MRQIFIFTAGDREARKHLADSILNPVSAGWLDDELPTEDAQYFKSLLTTPEGFFAWGAVPGPVNLRTWNAMQVGDVVLTVYDNQYHFVSSVIGKLHSASLAARIWGRDEDGNTWEHMYLLSKPQPTQVPVLESPVVDDLSKGYRGFTKIADAKLQAIVGKYGSVEAFIKTVFSAQTPPTVIETDLQQAEEAADQTDVFDPHDQVDGRKKVLAEIVRRQGQPKFRKALLDAYGRQCCVTGCGVLAVLEAAHILPYAGTETNHVTNGLLLRADIHTLFDLGQLKIDEEGIIHLDEALASSIYEPYRGKKVRFPSNTAQAPHPVALAKKFSQVL